jgi:hypothetical protein
MTTQIAGTPWFTSSFSNGSGACVEVRFRGERVDVRDTKDRTGGVLTVTAPQWAAFLGGSGKALAVERSGGRWHLRAAGSETVLRFTDAEWRAYRAGAAAGEFDPPRVAVCR